MNRKSIDWLLLMKWDLKKMAMEYSNVLFEYLLKALIMTTGPPAEIRIVNLQNTKLSHMLENAYPNSGTNIRN
jgi:hypothetical protein